MPYSNPLTFSKPVYTSTIAFDRVMGGGGGCELGHVGSDCVRASYITLIGLGFIWLALVMIVWVRFPWVRFAKIGFVLGLGHLGWVCKDWVRVSVGFAETGFV